MNHVILPQMFEVKNSLTHRQRQALETQRLIIEAAKTLFLEQGYALTTIQAIAAQAGVAVSTVYSIFTNKRGILKAIRETWHLTSQVRDIYKRAKLESDPARRLELYAHANRRQWETGGAMVAIYTSAAAADPEAAAELQTALSGRRKSVSAWLEETVPSLKPDLTFEQICAIYLAVTRAEVYQELVEEWGWTPDAYEAWLAGALKQQLLP